MFTCVCVLTEITASYGSYGSHESYGSHSSESDDECTGRVIVVACVVTFIVSVTATAIITFILTRVYVKRKFENIYDFQGHQSSDVQEKLLYEEMSSSSDTFTENGVKLQPHPAYQVMK